jgi:membrane-bound serine protease (ClpP class)
MTLIFLLFAIGLVFMAVEVIVPGGILGVAGGLFLLAATIVTFLQHGTTFGVIALASSVLLSGLTVVVELYIIRHTPLGKKAFLNAEITSSSSNFEKETKELIGKSAESATMLSPTGYVTIDGRSYEAFCPSGQIPVGTSLRVIGSDNFRLIVSPNNPTT